MKIAILVSMFPPANIGGTEIATQNIARVLVKKGHEVFVITSSDKGFPEKHTEDGFLINRISYPKIKYFGILIFWLKCFFVLRKNNPDIIQCQSINMSPPGLLYKIFFRKPYIVSCQGSDIYLKWNFKKIISKIIFSSATAVIALTKDMKKTIQQYCKREVIVIPNGINLQDFIGLSKEDIRKKMGISLSEKIIIFVGGIRPVKGVEYLIDAFMDLNKKNKQIKLFLVGGGTDKKKIEDIVAKNNLNERIIFTGVIKNNRVAEYLKMSDIFVLPSLSEGFGIVNLEAMACGLPIVSTNVGGIPEVVINGENGFLVDPRNAGQIAEKIMFLLENEGIRERVSKNNIEKSKKYDWNNIVGELERIYLKIVDK